jgi:isocitrate dehydrogenase
MVQKKIRKEGRNLLVPDNPVIPYIEGDGIGAEIWSAAKDVFNAAVSKAYNNKRKINWFEVYAGEKSFNKFGVYIPNITINVFDEYLVGMKGPLTTPVGKGIRSLNVYLRQVLDLYVCQRPVKYYGGIETPTRRPEKVDMLIFRENTEDIYTGVEFQARTEENREILNFIKQHYPEKFEKIKFGTVDRVNAFLKKADEPLVDDVEIGVGIKVISRTGTERLVHAAVDYAIKHKRKSITLVHKGNIMKYTSGAFVLWGYETAEHYFEGKIFSMREFEKIKNEKGYDAANRAKAYELAKGKILIKDIIADNALQLVLINPSDFDIIATENLNGDYLSDAVAAQVGGIGIAPGANINYVTGHSIFEATHGTAPSIAGMDIANPSSLILSGKMMLEYIGWEEAADLIEKALRKTIENKFVTKDFVEQMKGAKELKCSEFAQKIIVMINEN